MAKLRDPSIHKQGRSKGRAAGAAALAQNMKGADLGLVFLILYPKNRINDDNKAPFVIN